MLQTPIGWRVRVARRSHVHIPDIRALHVQRRGDVAVVQHFDRNKRVPASTTSGLAAPCSPLTRLSGLMSMLTSTYWSGMRSPTDAGGRAPVRRRLPQKKLQRRTSYRARPSGDSSSRFRKRGENWTRRVRPADSRRAVAVCACSRESSEIRQHSSKGSTKQSPLRAPDRTGPAFSPDMISCKDGKRQLRDDRARHRRTATCGS